MTKYTNTETVKKLNALQSTFKQKLSEKITEIEHLWSTFLQDKKNYACLKNLHRSVHSLAGSGGTFGAVAVSTVARELEILLKPLLKQQTQTIDNAVQQQTDELIIQLGAVADNWQPSGIPYTQPDEVKQVHGSNLVYLAEEDKILAKDLVINLKQAGYQVQHFAELSDFEAACEKEIPIAFIMDIVFRESYSAGADVITRLKENLEACPPVIFISARDDIEARLAAVRAGAQYYFYKPLDMKKLIHTLDVMTERLVIKPYRVLLIDDDESLLECYAIVLRNSGMEVEVLSQPLEGLNALNKFNPDIVVLDIYMPECSGLELTQIIRLDDAFDMMPIMFLSSETDLNRQLAAMNLGGDDFLLKPIEAGHLVAAVTARAKRARWSNQLNALIAEDIPMNN